MEMYKQGHLAFGENKVQELVSKQEVLPNDIEWHLIGHLQTNKVKYIAPFIHLIHSVDRLKLLREINKQGRNNDRIINCLLQFKIAEEDSKYGLDLMEAREILESADYASMDHVRIVGVMGMATFTENKEQIRQEFRILREHFDYLKGNYFADDPDFKEISMGMSGDYDIAIEEGSTMVRIGTLIFGARNYQNQ